jgi:ribose/xylose/arabinose/galactoside ABC-type transport system permease subunit
VPTLPPEGLRADVVTAVVIGGVNVFGGSGRPRCSPRRSPGGHDQDGFTLLKTSELWKIFNGAAIVAVVTIDALIMQRLQKVLRRRRRAEMLATQEQVAEA